MQENPKLNKKILQEELAVSQLTGVRKAWNTDTVASGLSPSKLANVLSSANEGNTIDYLTLAEEMEEREPHYGSVLRTRKLAIEGLPRTVVANDEVAEEIVEAVQKLVDDSAFDALIAGLIDGLGKGYAAVEIQWDDTFTPIAYQWRDPRYFQFAKDNAYKLLLRDNDNKDGKALPAYKFVIHFPKLKSGIPIRGGLARMAALSYMCKTYALTDWMAFCEVFGMPIRVGKYDNGASDNDKAILKKAVTYIGTDAAAIIPESMSLEFIETNSKGGENLYQNLANWLDKQMSKAVLGQTMTADDGSSQSQANVHNEVRLDLLRADAKQLAATINQQLIKPFVNFHFGEQKTYPQLSFYISEEEDLTALVDGVAKLVPLGLKVPQGFLRSKLGIPEPQEDEELLTGTVSNQSILKQDLNADLNTFKAVNKVEAESVEESDPDEENFIDLTQKAIEELVEKLQKAQSWEELAELLNTSSLSTDDLTEALAIAGVKAFTDGTMGAH